MAADTSTASAPAAPLLSTGGWSDDDVERWLTDHPLPADFTWNGERAYPRKTLLCGYGQWLRTSGPYHPALRGLFRLCCDVLINLPVGSALPDPRELAAMLKAHAARQGTLGLPDSEPTGNPAETQSEPTDNPPDDAY